MNSTYIDQNVGNKFYQVVENDSCQTIASGNGITLANFYSWNPAVGSSCSSLWLGYYVCVGVSESATTTTTTKATTTTTSNPTTTTASGPSPTQSGMVSGCTSYYQAKPGDTCSRILTDYYSYLTLAQFQTWNPAVGTGCTNMQAGYYYCMATADLRPQPGTISTCKKYHLVVNGDSAECRHLECKLQHVEPECWVDLCVALGGLLCLYWCLILAAVRRQALMGCERTWTG